ncbi:MAG: sulfatase-like hydrolase/transferase [Candidatus Latescibacteria bacterium]|nr:sulfatase-like hydrolase/transferase [Candidatus Latescibacterota bacterium]
MTKDRSRPNFLFITTDQQRWDTMGLHNPRIRTPAMDGLARAGMRCGRMYSTNAICMPARASMITGRSQRGHQVFNHNVNLSEAVPVLGDSLRAAGYSTALIGKAHFKTADIEDVLPDQPPPGAPLGPDGIWYGPYYGFDYAELHTGHAYPAGHWRLWLEKHYPQGLQQWRPGRALEPRSGAYASWKNALPAQCHYTYWTGDRTIDWLRGRDDEQPFFLWMSFADPHKPFAPPRPYCDMYAETDFPPPVTAEDVAAKPPQYDRARRGLPYGGYSTKTGWSGVHYQEIAAHYYGLTTFIDDTIARVLAELERLGLADDTHVVFTSDHGEGLGDHGIAAKPMMSYECVNRVPMLWRHPGVVAPGRTYDGVMTHLDLTPTFIDLAGADPLPGMEGRSFAPLLRGASQAHRDAVIVERISVLAATDGDQELVLRVKMLVTDKWKLLHYGSAPYGELYDVERDPEDLHNLWDEPAYAAVKEALCQRLLAELIDAELGDPTVILQRRSPGGALRSAKAMEAQAEKRGDLHRRIGNMN